MTDKLKITAVAVGTGIGMWAEEATAVIRKEDGIKAAAEAIEEYCRGT
ncbi:MAG: hypothetical protein K1W38_09765 [Lachnospiraceae bacterium]